MSASPSSYGGNLNRINLIDRKYYCFISHREGTIVSQEPSEIHFEIHRKYLSYRVSVACRQIFKVILG